MTRNGLAFLGCLADFLMDTSAFSWSFWEIFSDFLFALSSEFFGSFALEFLVSEFSSLEFSSASMSLISSSRFSSMFSLVASSTSISISGSSSMLSVTILEADSSESSASSASRTDTSVSSVLTSMISGPSSEVFLSTGRSSSETSSITSIVFGADVFLVVFLSGLTTPSITFFFDFLADIKISVN